MEILTVIFNPAIMFFVLGLFAVLFLKSNLEIPESVVKFITIYLMIAIGFKGGVALFTTPFAMSGIVVITTVLLMSAFVPLYTYYLLKNKVGRYDASAIGATYGSNSTLTYITAAGFLASIDITYGAYMTIALVLMETPAIIASLMIAKGNGVKLWENIKTAIGDGTVITLLGSMLIGYLTVLMGNSENILTAFIGGDLFSGMLIFFLLYMGTLVGKKILEIDSFPAILWVYAIFAPIFHAAIALGIAVWFALPAGSSFLLVILCTSSSYIVAPAILKDAMPEANPAKYLSMSMGITFPINIVAGIPVYWWLIGILL